MDIAESLDHSYEEQCFLQIDRLREELLNKYCEENKRWRKNRLYRQNIYEDIDAQQRQYLERVLCYSLKSLGRQINQNLVEAARQTAHNSVRVVDRRDKSNYLFDDQSGVMYLKTKKNLKFNVTTLSKQALILHVVAKVLKLIETQSYMTQRELYYLSLEFCQASKRSKAPTQTQGSCGQGTQFTNTQGTSQANSQHQNTQQASQSQPAASVIRHSSSKLEIVLNDLCCLLGCSKVHLHVLAQSKGVVYGNLRFRLKSGELFDCLSKKEGVALPTPNVPITEVHSSAKFIIVLEKDCVMQKILNQENIMNFVQQYKVILFTAKGYPDLASRAFLNFLWSKLKIPILAMTDADPHGLEIVCSYKFGCYATAYEGPSLAVPQMKWLGLLPVDVNRLALPESSTLPLTQGDVRKINSLLERPYLKTRPSWVYQLNLMRGSGRKAELEALNASGEYLLKTYLPNKLRYASWL